MRFLFAFFIVAAVCGFPVQAETLREAPSCFAAYGDVWGEKAQQLPKRKIDGATIASLNAFRRATGTRELGVKIIKGGDFSGWDFSDSALSAVCFEESKLVGAKFSGVDAHGTGFIKSDLAGADLSDAIMTGVMFRNANLSSVNAANANFSNGHFDGGWFEGAVAGWNLDGATMIGFTFECGITVPDGCPVYQGGDPISAKRVNLTRATLHSFGLSNVELDGAILDETIIGPDQISELHEVKFDGSTILRGGKSDVTLSASEFGQLIEASKQWEQIAARPAFDCSKVSNEAEHYICGEYGQSLRQADREMKVLYDRVKRINPAVRTSQLAWLKKRNACGLQEHPYGCLTESYSLRKGELLGMLGEQDWLQPEEEALFVDEVLPVPDKFRETELYQRIVPTLVGASRTEILVKRLETGLYTIRGSSVGANAHTCSVGAIYLYFDKKTGWYVPVAEGKPVPIFRIFEDRLEIFENGRPDYKTQRDAADFMSCGMRASFGEAVRIDADKDTVTAIRKSLEETM